MTSSDSAAGDHAWGEEQKDEARADAGGRRQQNRPSPHPIGYAANKGRSQQFAARIASKQQTDIFNGYSRVVTRPEREKRHQRAVGDAGQEEQERGNARGSRRGTKCGDRGGQEIENARHVKAPSASWHLPAQTARGSAGRVD